MQDRRTRQGVMSALSLALLMIVGTAAANEDLRLVDAMKNQDPQRVRTLLGQHADQVHHQGGARGHDQGAHPDQEGTDEHRVHVSRVGLSGFRLSEAERHPRIE